MGEVRATLRLTNAFDQGKARRNMITPGDIRVYAADALVGGTRGSGSGAVRPVLPAFVAERLGLVLSGRRVVEYADGRKGTVGMTEPLVFEVAGRETSEEALVLGDEVIIGQTVLEKWTCL